MRLIAREATLRALGTYRRYGSLPDKGFGSLYDGNTSDPRESALVLQIFNGVLQNMAYLDFIVSSFSSMDIKKIHPLILDILRLSVYQIIFLDRIPHSAAVNEGVLLAKKQSNPRTAGFVNAVLRKVAASASQDCLPEVANEDEFQYLSVKYSHPEWLVREFCGRLGPDETEKLLRINNSSDTPMTAQVNTLSTDVGTVLSSLAADGVETSQHEWLSDCVLMRRFGPVESLEAFKKGHIYIQDVAARLVVLAADPKPGQYVIDGCAAPGGKSITAAIKMNGIGKILACDVSISKLERIKESVSRLGIGIISVFERNALERDQLLTDKADVVFADVPCSGFGTIRKKPDIRYKPQEKISGLTNLQRDILSNLATYVKPGGTLLYSTCTVLEHENEGVIESFLSEHKDFSAVSFELPGLGRVPDGKITLWPHIHGTDGFFICKMRRSEAE